MALHENEIPVGTPTVRRLIADRFPEWASLPVEPAGGGTDNQMFRLGDDLVVRLPRTPDHVAALTKEITWLPRLAPYLSLQIPRPASVGSPTQEFPLPWAVYRWIDGDIPNTSNVSDWAAYGTDLATFVRTLHATDLMGAGRANGLDSYRGGIIQGLADEMPAAFDDLAVKAGDRLDVARLRTLWNDALALPEPDEAMGWLHGDLKPTNMLVRDGRLVAVLDFGGLTIGYPDAEHAPVWNLPTAAREAYRRELEVDDEEWLRARGWSLAIGVNSATYYWDSFPDMREESLTRLDAILADAS